MFYSLPQARIDRSTHGFYPPEEVLNQRGGEWRAVTVLMDDLVREVGESYHGKGDITRERFAEYLFAGWRGDKCALPESLKILVLVGGFQEFARHLKQESSTTVEEMMDWFDKTLAAMIRANYTDQWRCEEAHCEEMFALGGATMSEPQEEAGPPGYSPEYVAERGKIRLSESQDHFHRAMGRNVRGASVRNTTLAAKVHPSGTRA